MKKHLPLFMLILLILFSPLQGQIKEDTSICKAAFSYKIDSTIISIAPSLAIRFINESSPDDAQYFWSFGDGNISTEKNPFHIYSLLPVDSTQNSLITEFNACLTISPANECVDSICRIIKATPDTTPETCQVYFTYYKNDSIVTIPELIPFKFMGISKDPVVKWLWDFGDSTSSSDQNPQHSFNFRDSIRYVCLTIETASGCKTSYCQAVIINHYPCNANFTYSVSKSIPPIYNFHDLSAGNISKWYWDFGDGTYSYDQNPNHIFKNPPAYIFDSAGYKKAVYKVCLSISGSYGCYSMKCTEIFVPVFDSIPNDDCNYKVMLSYNQVLGSSSCNGYASALLADESGNSYTGTKYLWSNGSTKQFAEGLCPNFPYYVIITANEGCETAASFALMDYTSPIPFFGFWKYRKDSSGYEFESTSRNPELQYEWEFGSGNVKKGDTVTYNSAPVDKVILRVKDTAGNVLYTENIYLSGTSIQNDTESKSGKGKLHYYPNPVAHTLYIKLDTTQHVKKIFAEVYNATGKILISQSYDISDSDEEIQLDVNALTKGLYYVKLKSEAKPIGTVRFVK